MQLHQNRAGLATEKALKYCIECEPINTIPRVFKVWVTKSYIGVLTKRLLAVMLFGNRFGFPVNCVVGWGFKVKELHRASNILCVSLACVVLMASFESMAGKGGGGNSKGKGNTNPYSLSVTAMQDVNGVTDVQVNLDVVIDGVAEPDRSKHIQMKSFDTEGELRWTENLKNVDLVPGDGMSSVNLNYDDMSRHQPVQSQVQVQNGDTEVMKITASVMLRPDVTVDDIQATDTVLVGESLTVSAMLEELNGDLGATTRVTLASEEGVELDAAEAVMIDPLGDAAVVFAVSFNEAGTYSLTISATEVNPGDYDMGNNALTFEVEVVNPQEVDPASYYLSYYWNQRDYFYQWSDYYSSGTYSETGKWENFYDQIYLTNSGGQLNFPVDEVSLDIYSDGILSHSFVMYDLPITSTYNSGCYSQQYSYVQVAQNSWLYVINYDSCGYKQSYAYYSHYSSDYVYHSINHNHYYGTTYENSGVYQHGYFLDAKSTLDTRFTVVDDGLSFGGDHGITLTEYPYDYTWNNSWNGGWSYGYDRGTYVNGYGYGTTQP